MMDNISFWPFVIMLGVSSGLTAWMLAHLVLNVPSEDRAYLDRPPLGFRLCWRLIYLLAWYVQMIAPEPWLHRYERKLQQAGLDFVLTPSQLLASHLVAGLAGSLLGMIVAFAMAWPVAGAGLALGGLGLVYPGIWLKEKINQRQRNLLKTLPFYLDVITLCVEAGLNFNGAIKQSTLKGPPGVLREEFQRILRDIRAGKQRSEALRAFAYRVNEPSIGTLVSSIIQAETLGMSLGPILRSQAEQRRMERFLRAEKLAMEAPVKMLFPLVAFIFPCTFVVLGFPILMMFKDIQ